MPRRSGRHGSNLGDFDLALIDELADVVLVLRNVGAIFAAASAWPATVGVR